MIGTQRLSLAEISKIVNRPSVTISAVVLGLWLGIMRFPFLQYLQPIGDFYIALLQMCVLPFLLATIPLAVRSALTSGAAGKAVGRLGFWLLVTFVATALIAVIVPTVVFYLMPLDDAATSRIGTLVGTTANRVDVEFALNPLLADVAGALGDSGILSVVPTNIFSALSSNDSIRVIIFAIVFGTAMVLSERHSGTSIFNALKHIQVVCLMIFDWFNVIAPIGIVALVAPQVSLLGPDIYTVLAPFAYAYFLSNILLLLLPLLVIASVLRLSPKLVMTKFLRPLAFVAATRNALVCAPATLDVLKKELGAQAEPCELYVPIAFAVVRFGNMIHFATATLFIGYLLGRSFDAIDLVLVAFFSVMASFATIGLTGIAGLAPMAAVMRPFGLSYELALPLMAIMDPIASMIRGMNNVALNSHIPVLAADRRRLSAETMPAAPSTAAAVKT
ncbi:MAG: dicarboxylate/amino acid:cation symporter [Burkholderiales bacterium]